MRLLLCLSLPLGLLLATAACHRSDPAAHDRGASKDVSDAGHHASSKLAVVAPTDHAAPKRPPPLRAPHPPVPALPDLPELSRQERAAEAPHDAHLDDEPCRAVWTGSAKASLSCAKALQFGATQEAGARLLVPRSLLSRSPSMLPTVVDHRRDGTEGPVRNQTTAPACTAFAEAAALDHALARWSGRSAEVSVMQLWSRYHSPSEESSLASNVTRLLGQERDWPFNVTEANRWVPCDLVSAAHRRDCGKKVDDSRVKQLESKAIGEFTEVEYLGKPDVTVLEAKLAAGQDVIVAIEVPPSLVPRGKPGARYIPNYTRSGGPGSGHALVLAGYANFPHGAYLLAHNSWGTAWGDGGYAWIHMATLSRWAKQLVAVDAEPVERDAAKRPRRTRGTFACAPNLVPDSIAGRCSEACPDHSPRHADVCATGSDCPKDFVNLTGECVLAAPAVTGKDPDTGVAWTCGPGGCSYTLPKSVDPSCTGSVCQVSCPAPDFHVAKMGGAIVCVE